MSIDLKKIEKITELSKKNTKLNPYYKKFTPEIYFWFLKDEIKEVEDELKKNNKVYLEDELWDIIWVYFNLLNKLENEGLIDKNKVFDRSYKKFSERLAPYFAWSTKSEWDEIKKVQKESLLEEHNRLYW